MTGKTNIEWTHIPGFIGESWNPFVGCDIVSKGCTNCYAMKMAARLEAMSSRPDGTGNFHLNHYQGLTHNPRRTGYKPVWTGKVNPAPDKTWTAPLRAKKPRCYFVNSMGDVFHENVPDEWIDRLFAVMALAPQHRFLILTKRPGRMREYVNGIKTDVPVLGRMPLERVHMKAASHMEGAGGFMDVLKAAGNVYSLYLDTRWPLPNVWLGTSVEDQASADQRIPYLLATRAAIRFISAEPLLGPVDLTRVEVVPNSYGPKRRLKRCGIRIDALTGTYRESGVQYPEKRLDWVIAGGESGPDARPCHPDWLRGLRDQGAAAQVPFFLKQWGAWQPELDRDRDDPDWRADYSHYNRSDRHRVVNLEGGHGFHGDRVHIMCRVGKKAAGHLLDGQTHHAWPERQP